MKGKENYSSGIMEEREDNLAKEPSFEERNEMIHYGEEMASQMKLLKNNGHFEAGVFTDTEVVSFDFYRPSELTDNPQELNYENLAALRLLAGEERKNSRRCSLMAYLYNEYHGDMDLALSDLVYNSEEVNPRIIQEYKDIKKSMDYMKKSYEEYGNESDDGEN